MVGRDHLLFEAIQQVPNLRSGLVDTLLAQIESGQMQPGQRLPTEQAIVAATGVSRTVVREALASLRAKGMIVTRQGLGAFVADHPPPKAFSLVPTDVASIDEVLGVLELRMGVEVEGAGLAARRRTDGQLAQMRERLAAIDAAIAASETGAKEDFEFHRAIAAATGNVNFMHLFDAFGAAMMPRQWESYGSMTPRTREKILARMHAEHMAIYSAIADGNVAAAQREMRSHLTRSYKRFEKLRESTAG